MTPRENNNRSALVPASTLRNPSFEEDALPDINLLKQTRLSDLYSPKGAQLKSHSKIMRMLNSKGKSKKRIKL